MPYRSVSELPRALRDHLPPHAQDIYRQAFNNAWDQYADPSKRGTKGTREETAHRVAWSAVGRVYEKDANGRWRKR